MSTFRVTSFFKCVKYGFVSATSLVPRPYFVNATFLFLLGQMLQKPVTLTNFVYHLLHVWHNVCKWQFAFFAPDALDLTPTWNTTATFCNATTADVATTSASFTCNTITITMTTTATMMTPFLVILELHTLKCVAWYQVLAIMSFW